MRVICSITKNVKVDPQIAFWRLKDMKTKGSALSAVRIVRLKKMFDIIKKHYIMQTARAFWKIDRCLDLDQTMNSSFFYQQKLENQNFDMSPSPQMKDFNIKPNTMKSRGEILNVNFADEKSPIVYPLLKKTTQDPPQSPDRKKIRKSTTRK